MKKENFKPLDDVADSMAAAASGLGVPLEVVKIAKRAGCDAFRGSRVHLGKLREWLASAKKEPSTGDVLLIIAEQVASNVAEKLLLCRDPKFEAESDRLCQAVHLGFAVALCVVEPDSADEFLKKSSALFERVFEPSRKNRVDQPT